MTHLYKSLLITVCLVVFATAHAQDQAEVIGDVLIDGRLELFKGTSVFIGKGSGQSSTGLYGTFLGENAGLNNTSGANNTFIGRSTGGFNSSGHQNTFLGAIAGARILGNHDENTFVGYAAGNQADGQQNTLIGSRTGLDLVGNFNTALGTYAMTAAINCDYVTAVGFEAGKFNQSHANTFVGAYSGTAITTGEQNTFVGTSTALTSDIGRQNTLLGYTAGFSLSSGSSNTILGANAGRNVVQGSNNICLGNSAGPTLDASNKLFIDIEASNKPLIHGDFSTDVVKIHGNLQTEKEQSVLRMESLNTTNGSVIVLRNSTSIANIVGSINFENASGATAGQIAYETDNEMKFGIDNISAFMKLSNSTDHISMSNGAKLTAGGTWTNSCSAALKNLDAKVKGEEVLEKIRVLPIYEWNYKASAAEHHIGPTAEDFYALFALGNSDKNLASVDLGGVALAAIKELAEKNEALEKTIVEMKNQISALAKK